MHGFKYRMCFAHIGARHNTETANQSSRQIRNDIAVEIGQQQHVKTLGPDHKLHRGIIHDELLVLDLRKFGGCFAATAQKQTVGQLHDVGFVDGGNLLALVLARVGEGVAGNALGGGPRNHFQAGDDILDDFMLEARIKVFGVLAEDDHVDLHVGEACLNTGKSTHRPNVGEKIERLAQSDVYALKASGDRCRHRAFETDFCLVERIEHVLGQRLAGFENDGFVQLNPLPANIDTGSFDSANRFLRDFRTNAVAGYQSTVVGHSFDFRSAARAGSGSAKGNRTPI